MANILDLQGLAVADAAESCVCVSLISSTVSSE